MRSFEERKAEIFRRSEERIAARRRTRNRLLACFLPLLGCITVYSALILPAMLPAGRSPENEDAVPPENTDLLCPYVMAEIRERGEGSASYRKITEQTALADIVNTIDSFGRDESAPVTGEESAPTDQQTDAGGTAAGHTVTFTSPDGKETVYALIGNEWIDESTDQKLTLTDSQLARLKSVLGLLK